MGDVVHKPDARNFEKAHIRRMRSDVEHAGAAPAARHSLLSDEVLLGVTSDLGSGSGCHVVPANASPVTLRSSSEWGLLTWE